jgi:hypothetical protein
MLVMLLTSLIAELKMMDAIVDEKKDVKKQYLYQNINHPQLFYLNHKKLDDKDNQ